MEEASQKLLAELGLEPFRPLRGFASGHRQTLAALLWWQGRSLPEQEVHHLRLADDDQLVILENTPHSWRETDRILVLVHGLTGCHGSGYIKRLSRLFFREGYKVLRLNLRGCGPGFGVARNPYHSGRSEDTRELLRWLADRYPAAPVTQIGFSLGGNITLKMAGEDGPKPSGRLDSVIAVSPPVHLASCARRLARPENRYIDRYFVRKLKMQVLRLRKCYPDMREPAFPTQMLLRDFDEHFTAPFSGFRDAADYYEQSSSLPLLANIGVACLILCAHDDPVIDTTALQHSAMSPRTDLLLTPQGGHVGFLGRGARGFGLRWMDGLLVQWVRRHDARTRIRSQ